MPQKIPGAGRLFEAISKQGYTPETALADVIDNSIAAGATKVSVHFQDLPGGKTRVFIADNGKGMTLATLDDAMQLGSPHDLANGPLSRFGLGMKAASLTFSPKFSVIARKDGETSYASWDKRVQDAEPFFMELSEADATQVKRFEDRLGTSNGTLLVWDEAVFSDEVSQESGENDSARRRRLISQIADYLGFAFHNFMVPSDNPSQNPVSIFVNDEAVEPWNPVDEKFLVSEDEWIPWECEIEETVSIDGQDQPVAFKLRAFVVMGKNESTDDEAKLSKIGTSWSGIYPYREGRALRSPDWDDDYYKGHANLNQARIILEFDERLDELFKTPVNKSEIVLPNSIKKAIGDKLKPILADIRAIRGKRVTGPGPDAEQRAHQRVNGILMRGKEFVESPQFEGAASALNVTVTNNPAGPTEIELAHVEAEAANRRRHIELVDDLPGDALFEPRRRGADEVVVYISKNHDFYKKVYLPLLRNSLATAGLDLLLYAFTNAELLTGNERIRHQFKNWRMQISMNLGVWVSDEMDYPEDGEEDENGS